MYLTKVSYQNFQGSSANHDLKPLTLIGGGNGRGKSTIANAVVLSLLSKLPSVPATKELPGEKATFQLASGPYMSVGVDTNDQHYVRRSWATKGKSVTQTVDGGLPDEIEATLGTMLNIDSFFDQSAPARVSYLFSVIPISKEFTPEGLITKIRGIKVGQHTEAVDKAIDKLIENIKAFAEGTDNIQEFYEQAVVSVKEQKSDADAAVKQMAAGTDMIVQLQSMEEQVKAFDPVALAAKRSGLIDKENQLNSEHGRISQVRSQKLRNAKLVADAKLIIDAHPDFDPSVIEKKKTRRDELTHKLVELEAAQSAKRRAMNDASSALSSAATVLRERASDRDGCENNVEGFDKHTACPTCKAKAKGWKTEVMKTLQAALEAAEKAYAEAKDANRLATEAHSKANTEFLEASRLYQEARSEHQTLQREVEAGTQIQIKLSGAKATVQNAGDTTDGGEVKQMDDIMAKLTALREERSQVDQDIANATRMQQDIKRLAQSQKERQTAEAEAVVLKEAQIIIAAQKELMVNTAVQGVLAKAHFFTKGILDFTLAYQNNEFGYVDPQGGHWVSYRVFSGYERKIAFMAISLALSSTSKFKLAILDELGTLEPEVQDKFLDRIKEAVEVGVLDQFIGIMPVRKFSLERSKDFHTILVA